MNEKSPLGGCEGYEVHFDDFVGTGLPDGPRKQSFAKRTAEDVGPYRAGGFVGATRGRPQRTIAPILTKEK